jgi:hypothetical protein
MVYAIDTAILNKYIHQSRLMASSSCLLHEDQNLKMTAFWDTVTFSLVDADRRFRGTNCPHQGDGGSTYL